MTLTLLDWLAIAADTPLAVTLFGVGKAVFGETALGVAILAVAGASGYLVYRDLERRGWRAVVE